MESTPFFLLCIIQYSTTFVFHYYAYIYVNNTEHDRSTTLFGCLFTLYHSYTQAYIHIHTFIPCSSHILTTVLNYLLCCVLFIYEYVIAGVSTFLPVCWKICCLLLCWLLLLLNWVRKKITSLLHSIVNYTAATLLRRIYT